MKKLSPKVVHIPVSGEKMAKLKALDGSGSDDFNTIVSCQVIVMHYGWTRTQRHGRGNMGR